MRSLTLGVVWATTFWLLVEVATANPLRRAQATSSRGGHEPSIPTWKEPTHLRIYIVDNIPAAYTSGHMSQYSQPAGPAGPSAGPWAPAPSSTESGSSNDSDSILPEPRSNDLLFHQWMVEQLRASPLRVYEAEEADFFVIPTLLPADDLDLQASCHPAALPQGVQAILKSVHDRYVLNATNFLPWFKRKPHFIILNQPANAYLQSKLLRHRESKGFTFIVHTPVNDPSLDLQHMVVAPQMSRLRWTRGLLTKKQVPYDPQEALTKRTVLAQAGFPYGHQPSPDFRAVLRHETIIGGSIPAVFDKRYVNVAPFTDVLDYGQMMKVLPKVDFNTSERDNILDLLEKRFRKSKALHQLAYISDVRHVFQYMRNPAHEVLRWDQRSIRRPEDDAFTFTIKAAMRNLCGRRWQPERCFDPAKLG
ncbi:hypothetical protein WJX74_004204 [Apatococcus lobatus]|uniref:Exostosin GT47 domain-containing protein n=1 Tax=Apatococcus lobatus TaxID=904363 RepID=A0AAW1SA64_9CHLO